MNAARLLALHKQAEHLGDTRDLFADLEERYQLPTGAIERGVVARIDAEEAHAQFSYSLDRHQKAYGDAGAGPVLLELPETEFLTAIEHAVALDG